MAREMRRDRNAWGYASAAAMLLLALLFPVGLMVFDPTLMFERGWEQYVGTGIYFWAVLTLSRELHRLWKNERGFGEAPRLLKRLSFGAGGRRSERRAAPRRDGIRTRHRGFCLTASASWPAVSTESSRPSVTQLMEVNRESSGLDQEQMAGRFTLTRYILYLLAGDWVYRHGRGHLSRLDEYQQGAADGEEPRRFLDQPDERDGGLADRV